MEFLDAEIAARAKRILFNSEERYGLEDQLFYYVKLGEYDLHYHNGGSITINQHGYVHGTIFRTGRWGSVEERRPEHMEVLVRVLRRHMVLDDLAEVAKPNDV